MIRCRSLVETRRRGARCRAALVALVILSFVVRPAAAWGPGGHEIVARIANRYLADKARNAVHKLLRDEKLYDRSVANWADEIREGGEYDRVYPKNHRWHFVDIPYEEAKYDPRRQCRNQECVIAQIERFRKVIANTRLPKDERYEALKFLVHFVADLHQPLHCVEWNRDNGGSLRQVRFLGQRGQSNLHRVWDSQILNYAMQDDEPDQFADELLAQITPDRRARWEQGTVVDWALEAHDVGVKHCYEGFTHEFSDNKPVQITPQYVKKNQTIVREQLSRAGVRLAKTLNDAFAAPAASDSGKELPQQKPQKQSAAPAK